MKVRWLLMPNHPTAKAATLEATAGQRLEPVPGMSDHELGGIFRGADDAGEPVLIPTRPQDVHRARVTRARWDRLVVALAVYGVLLAALCVLVTRWAR